MEQPVTALDLLASGSRPPGVPQSGSPAPSTVALPPRDLERGGAARRSERRSKVAPPAAEAGVVVAGIAATPLAAIELECTPEEHDRSVADPERWETEWHGHALWPDYGTGATEAAHCRRCKSTKQRPVPWVLREVDAEELDAKAAAA